MEQKIDLTETLIAILKGHENPIELDGSDVDVYIDVDFEPHIGDIIQTLYGKVAVYSEVNTSLLGHAYLARDVFKSVFKNHDPMFIIRKSPNNIEGIQLMNAYFEQ